MTRSGAKVGLGLCVLLSACGFQVDLVLERAWSVDDPIAVVAVDLDGLMRGSYLPPSEVQRLEVSLIDDLSAIYVRSYPILHDYDPFGGCAIALGGGEGTPIAAGGSWWSETIDEDGSIALEVEIEPRAFDLRLLGCAPRIATCELGITQQSAPMTFGSLGAAVALPGGRLIAAGGNRGPTDHRSLLLYFDESGPRELGPYDEVSSVVAGFALRGDRVIGAAYDRWFELDTTGNFVRSSTIGFFVSNLQGGPDGSIGIIGSLGEIAIIAADADELVELVPPPYGADQGERPRIALRSSDSVLVIGPDRRLYLWEGGRWRQQLVQAESFAGISADLDDFVVSPTRSTIQRRRGNGEWVPLGQSMNVNGVEGSVPVDGERFLFGGQSGQLLYWNGEAMCVVTSGTGRNLDALTVEVGTRTAWAVGERSASDSVPTILRIELPE